MSDESDRQRRMEENLRKFEEALREHLQAEAREAIDGAVERFSTGPFTVTGIELDVVIHNLTVDLAPGPPARRPQPLGQGRRTGMRGRPPGPLRSALLDIFAATDGDLHVSDVRTELDRRGIERTSDHLLQQLGRLTDSGHIQRVGRGRYRRGRC